MPFNIALTGLNAANQDLNVTANNLANVSSTGFKSSRAEFGDLFASTQRGVSRTAVGNGVSVNEVSQQFTQGNIETTGNNLDLAISGNGFFTMSTGGALSYTRDGEFQVSSAGLMTTKTGDVVLDVAGSAINVPTGDVKVGPDGTVSVASAEGSAIVGRIDKRDAADVVIVSRSQLQKLAGNGGVLPGSLVNIAGISLGVAVRKGAPRPDISNVEAFKRTLLAARSIGYRDPITGSTSARGNVMKAEGLLFPYKEAAA